MEDSEPTRADQEAFIAELQENGRRFAERSERSPWTLELRAVMAEAERSGGRKPIDDLVRRYKKYEAERWPR
jgi:hypothetical protein